jgi:uncharacterized membrane protein
VGVLVADIHPDEQRAAAVLAALHRLRALEALGLADAAVVVRHADTRVTVWRRPDLAAAAACPELWDALATLLVMTPPPAPGTGAALRPVLARLAGLGVSARFAVHLALRLAPATSAGCLVVADASLRALLDRLRPFGGVPLHTPLAG